MLSLPWAVFYSIFITGALAGKLIRRASGKSLLAVNLRRGKSQTVTETDATFSLRCKNEQISLNFNQADYDQCFKAWQKSCEDHWSDDSTASQRICHEYLGRPHLKSHLTLHASQVRTMMKRHLQSHWQANAMPRLFVPRHTALGWKLMQPPRELHQRVAEWFESQRHRMLAEDWPGLDDVGCNNNFDNDDYILPHDEAAPVMEMGKWIKEHLQQWMGTEVDPTWHTFYGARLQHSGSTCAMHVDSTDTHVMSATYNIAQRGMRKPWPLSFVEPGGAVKRVEQQPGDIIFYEGASGMHGRPVPLDGQEFVSIYFHWHPKGWKKRLSQSLASNSFESLVEVKEPKQGPYQSLPEARVLDGSTCPADSDDTHAAAGIPDLWRGAHTSSKRIFDPSQVTFAQVRERATALARKFEGGSVASSTAAAQVIHDLGLFDYVALHARDLTSVVGAVAPSTVLARWVGYLQPGTKLYVAGEGAEAYKKDDLGSPLGIHIFTKKDYPVLLQQDAEAEVLICAYARLFIGSSDVSSGLTRRAHEVRSKAGAPSTVLLQHQDSKMAALDAYRADEVGKEYAQWKFA